MTFTLALLAGTAICLASITLFKREKEKKGKAEKFELKELLPIFDCAQTAILVEKIDETDFCHPTPEFVSSNMVQLISEEAFDSSKDILS